MFAEALIIIFGVPSLIVTLGGMVILQGLLLVVLPPGVHDQHRGHRLRQDLATYIPAGWSFALAGVGWLLYCAARYRSQHGSG